MSARLKPCPFCGMPGEIVETTGSQASGSPVVYRAVCSMTGHISMEWTPDYDEAVTRWNERTERRTQALAAAFCATPLPYSVSADLCATIPGDGRTGTNLLTFNEATEMMVTALDKAGFSDRPPARENGSLPVGEGAQTGEVGDAVGSKEIQRPAVQGDTERRLSDHRSYLKPCPFCTSKAKLAQTIDDEWWIFCTNDECKGNVGYFDSEDEARFAWAFRYNPMPQNISDDIACVRAAVTDDEWERLFVSLHSLKCNPTMDEIALVMPEIVAILRNPQAAA